MKKTVFKSMLCSVLAIFMLISLTSCGESRMDKIESRLLEIRENPEEDIECILGSDVPYYDSQDRLQDLDKVEEEINKIYGVDVEIERKIYNNFINGYTICEFKTVSDAKEFTKAYRDYSDDFCDRTHPDYANELKLERIQELISGEYEGHLTNLFMCNYTAERSGKIVVYGSIEAVEFIMDNVIE